MIQCQNCNKIGNNWVCNKCLPPVGPFNHEFCPCDDIAGSPKAPVWIVGLNPKTSDDSPKTSTELRDYFNRSSGVHPYFRNFEKVSKRLYAQLGKTHGVASTDLVKCHTESWPKNGGKVVANCSPFLVNQVSTHRPKMLICNGAPVCDAVTKIYPPPAENPTSYMWKGPDDGEEVVVVLSGFIGRIDDYAKQRLGKEIDCWLDKLSLFIDDSIKPGAVGCC